MSNSVFRIPPYHYIHVLDLNANVTRLEIGPRTFVKQDNEKVTLGPEKMITIPPRNYCVIQNPVGRDAENKVLFDASGEAKLIFADSEIRFSQDPFPLYPGEVLKQVVTPLKVIPANSALRLKAILDITEDDVKRIAGDEWLFEGPGTYMPRKEVLVEEQIRATVIKTNQAIRLLARKECNDRSGTPRVTGEEWIVKKNGAYLPGAYEEVVSIVDAHVLTEKKALHLRAIRSHVDEYNKKRLNGEEWLITFSDTDSHIPNVYEEVVGVIKVTTLNSRQYAVILDPTDENGKPQLGKKKLVKGEKSFFLQPGESLETGGPQDVYVLGEDEGLIIRCLEAFDKRVPGDRWMIKGPCDFVPSVNEEVVSLSKATPLDENEGIYVRDIKSGKVRAVIGHTYMLNQDEELWNKNLPEEVEALLAKDALANRGQKSKERQLPVKGRVQSEVVRYKVPHNGAVQIYDYKLKKSRVIFGPELVMLGPEEQFTLLSISGDTPKRPNVIKAICLLLGPDFFTDVIQIETADHARLSLKVSFNWHFKYNVEDPKDASKIFNVPDFVGDACKAVASRIRGTVAAVNFDDFHKNSASIIRTSIFGLDENRKIRGEFSFSQNNLILTNVDIQAVEPIDQRTRDSLQKSVQLAIEITTNSQEAAAKHEAERLEQEARGKLERQKIMDEAESENSRRSLLELQSLSAAVESSGQAKAEAQSRAEAMKIEYEAAVDQARLKAEAQTIEASSELERLTSARTAELAFIKEQNSVEVKKSQEMAEIESNKFKNMVDAIGAQTIKEMASAGPELQLKMLSALGLQSTLITDGTNPINLFNTANGLVGAMTKKE
jgi:major vault protein